MAQASPEFADEDELGERGERGERGGFWLTSI